MNLSDLVPSGYDSASASGDYDDPSSGVMGSFSMTSLNYGATAFIAGGGFLTLFFVVYILLSAFNPNFVRNHEDTGDDREADGMRLLGYSLLVTFLVALLGGAWMMM